MQPIVRIGTRGSRLALWQAQWVEAAVRRLNPGIAVEIVTVKTLGDKILDSPLAEVGGKGLFVKEIEESLLDGRIDLAVHSLKDMPSDIPPALCIGPIPERAEAGDALISKSGLLLTELPKGARIGTSSLRRAAQLRHLRPDLIILPLRGNVETRIRKIETEAIDAIVLAAAGLRRLGLAHLITENLDFGVMLPAVGQGALGLEHRKEDSRTAAAVAGLNHPDTFTVVMGERAFLNRLEGGCQVPIAAHGVLKDHTFRLEGMVAAPDGTRMLRDKLSGPEVESEAIGVALAERLLSLGAKGILEELNADGPSRIQR